MSKTSQKKSRKPLKIIIGSLVALVSILAIVLGLGISSGSINPDAPLLGVTDIGKSEETIGKEAAETGKALTPEDTVADGSTEDNTVDMRGAKMLPDEGGDYPTREQVKKMNVQPYTGHTVRSAKTGKDERTDGRFRIDSKGLNVPLNTMSVVDGIATPPGFRAAYLLRGYGTSPETPEKGTVFVMVHSAMGYGYAPGNYLVNKHTGKSKVENGTIVTVDGVNYKITGHENVLKSQINTRNDIWADTPNRLVVITCQQQNGKHTTHNSVFYAERVN